MYWKRILQNSLTIFFIGTFCFVLLFGIIRAKKQSIVDQVVPVEVASNANGTKSNNQGSSNNRVPSNTNSTNSSQTGTKQTFDGTAYRTPWGNVELQIEVASGRITQVTSITYPDSPPSVYAKQDLIKQALNAQSGNIQGVSGATYTSLAFAKSLESAISNAGSSLQ